jgi:hypothetical protein
MMILMLGPALPVSVVMAVVHRVLPIEPEAAAFLNAKLG